jgi:hypothetical protein
VGGIRRTVVVITDPNPATVGDYMFIQGGISAIQRPDCTEDAATSPCAIDIKVGIFVKLQDDLVNDLQLSVDQFVR